MTTVAMNPQASLGAGYYHLVGDQVSTNQPRLSTKVPHGVPALQLYFWTDVWQEGEREAENAIAEGEVRAFTNGRDAVRWLLDEDD